MSRSQTTEDTLNNDKRSQRTLHLTWKTEASATESSRGFLLKSIKGSM